MRIHTLLLGAGSFVALMVVSCTPTWPGDAHTLLLGAGLFVALMVVDSCTPHGRVMHIHCYLVLAHL